MPLKLKNKIFRAEIFTGVPVASGFVMKHFRDGVRGGAGTDEYGQQMAQAMPGSISDEAIRALAQILDPSDRSR